MNSDGDTPEQVRGGLPHSEIPGSPIARISPGLFAACRVLPRLSVPRHPPDALLLRLIAITPPAHRGKTRTLRQQGGRAPASLSLRKQGRGPIHKRPRMKTLSDTPRASPNAGALGVAHATPAARPQPGCGRGGGERIRTDDLLLAKQALSQLSYTPFRNQEPG